MGGEMNDAAQSFLDHQLAVGGALPGHGLDWLRAQHDAARARFAAVGFPTRRDEDWRYTEMKSVTAKKFQPATPQNISQPMSVAPLTLKDDAGGCLRSHLMVFVNGLFAPDHSVFHGVADGVTVSPLAKVLLERPELVKQFYGDVVPDEQHGFTALNGACSRDGVVVIVEADARPDVPIEMLFISRDQITAMPRNLIIAGEGSAANIIERYVSVDDAESFTNSVTEVILGANASIDYYLLQNQAAHARQVSGMWVRQESGSRFSSRTITLGGALVRNDLRVDLHGASAHCDMFGVYSLSGRQHVDNHTTIVHKAENCTSNELYKGVLAQRARAVFHGRIKVAPGAQKTDAHQANNTLLLSPDAEIDTKPQLEIYADEVKCSHGATVGQLDHGALFYLRARGIGEAQARAMLTVAFVAQVVDNIKIGALKLAVENALAATLSASDPPNHH